MQSLKLDHEAMEGAYDAAFNLLHIPRDPLERDGVDVLHLLDAFEPFGVRQAIPKRTPDAQEIHHVYVNLRVLQADDYSPNHDKHAVEESVGIFAELCRELMALHEAVQSENEGQQHNMVEVLENVVGCLRSEKTCTVGYLAQSSGLY